MLEVGKWVLIGGGVWAATSVGLAVCWAYWVGRVKRGGRKL